VGICLVVVATGGCSVARDYTLAVREGGLVRDTAEFDRIADHALGLRTATFDLEIRRAGLRTTGNVRVDLATGDSSASTTANASTVTTIVIGRDVYITSDQDYWRNSTSASEVPGGAAYLAGRYARLHRDDVFLPVERARARHYGVRFTLTGLRGADRMPNADVEGTPTMVFQRRDPLGPLVRVFVSAQGAPVLRRLEVEEGDMVTTMSNWKFDTPVDITRPSPDLIVELPPRG